MRRNIILATTAIVLLAGPAYSQGLNLAPGERHKSPEELERERAIEQDYNAAAAKIPDKPASKDPWGNVRSAPSKPTAAKQRSQ